jgi:hypothetical protein
MAFYDDKRDVITMRSVDSSAFSFDSYPACGTKSVAVRPGAKVGIFTRYQVVLPEYDDVKVTFKQVSDDVKFKAYCDSLVGNTPKGPTYGIHYDAALPYKAYSLTLPAKMPEFVHDVLLQFDYRGNTAALYAGGTIIADDYYSGTTMPYSLARHTDLLGKKPFVLQITPLMENRQIHFEPGTELDFAKTVHAELKGIIAKPVYEVSF